eukprot:6574563-Prymnesium_polylepis.1
MADDYDAHAALANRDAHVLRLGARRHGDRDADRRAVRRGLRDRVRRGRRVLRVEGGALLPCRAPRGALLATVLNVALLPLPRRALRLLRRKQRRAPPRRRQHHHVPR